MCQSSGQNRPAVSALPETGRNVHHLRTTVDAVEALVGGTRLERTVFLHIRTELDIVKRFSLEIGRRVLPAGIPPYLDAAFIVLLDLTRQGHYLVGMSVAAHQPDTRHTAGVGAQHILHALQREPLAAVALQVGAVAAGAAVGAPRNVDGQGYLVGKLLEHDVRVGVFQHCPTSSFSVWFRWP